MWTLLIFSSSHIFEKKIKCLYLGKEMPAKTKLMPAKPGAVLASVKCDSAQCYPERSLTL